MFQNIKAGAIAREQEHDLPFAEVQALRQAGLTRWRLPVEWGGQGANLDELFSALIELGEADPNVVNAIRAHQGFVEDVLQGLDSAWRSHWLQRL